MAATRRQVLRLCSASGLAIVAGLLAASTALAAPTTLVGGRRVISRSSSTPSRVRTVVRFSSDAALASVANPRCPASSTLRIVADGYDSGELVLPCSGWVASTKGYHYLTGSNGIHGIRNLSVGDGKLSLTLGGALHRPIPSTATFVEIRLMIDATEACGRLHARSTASTTTFRAFGPSTACTAMPPRPNFLVVYLDDTRGDAVDQMPVLHTRLEATGHSFANAFTPDALCCPSRASVLTGLSALHHGTRGLFGPFGGAHSFREFGTDRNTIAVWLQRAGYHTGLFGKYLNGYDANSEGGLGPNGGLYVPPGWDRWWAQTSPEFFGGVHGLTYSAAQEDGSLTVYDDHSSDAQYSTDLGATKLRDFVSAAVAAGRPFFAYWAPLASHGDGYLPPAPAARHFGLFDDLPLWRPPSWDEADVTDKPRFVVNGPIDTYLITDVARSQGYEALLSIDEQLGAFLDLVESLGVANDTVVVFTSDNGVTWGEHGMFFQAKGCAYEECQRVPFVVHYPRLGTAGVLRDEAVLNVDVAPTVAELAGIAVPTAVDGKSLVPLLAGGAPAWRTDYLIEYYRSECSDVLNLVALPVDGDRVRLLHGDPWTGGVRPSAVFEFDGGDGVVANGATLVPILATAKLTADRLGDIVAATVPGTRHLLTIAPKASIEDATGACHGPVWWEEVDQTNALLPTNPTPSLFGVRDVARGYTWVEYETGERELYDLNVDPWQLESRHDDPAYAALRIELSARTAALRALAPTAPPRSRGLPRPPASSAAGDRANRLRSATVCRVPYPSPDRRCRSGS